MSFVYSSRLLVSGASPLTSRRIFVRALESQVKKSITTESALYQIIDGVLFRKNYDGVFLRCLEQEDAKKVIEKLHDGPAGGHFSRDTIAHKILRAGYYWPTLFKDAHAHAIKCDSCHICVRRHAKVAGPLKPIIISEPFEQWGIDVIREINPNSSLKHKYILTTTDYFTIWVEVIPVRKVNEDAVMDFLCIFGLWELFHCVQSVISIGK